MSAKNTTDIPAEANLNDYVYAGNYKVASDSVASQVNNIPVQRNGKLFVLAANNYIIQIYISSYGEMYIRSKIINTSWRSWQQVAVETLVKYVAFSMEYGVTPIQSNSDLDDYTTSGNYYISEGVKSTISNLPADVSGILVVGVPASYYRVQWYISCYGYFYLRSKYSTSSWSKWVRLATMDDINESSQVSYGRRNAIASANQMLNIKWTPIRPIPATNSAGYVDAGVECTGLPYSSTRSVCKYIGQHLTFYTFMSALQNPRSVLYTRRIKYGDLGKSYYGITCFTFTSYASGSKLGMFDNEITRMTDGTDVEISPYQIEIGDMLELIYDRETLPDPYDTTKQQPAQHTFLVYDIKKDSQGRITNVTLAQASPPFATKNSMPFSVFLSSYVYGGLKYKVYKMDKRLDYGSYEKNNQVKGYSDEVLIPDTYPDIMPEYGDRACVEAGTDVVINIINSRTYNAINVYKDNVLIDTKTTIEDFTMSDIDYGTYRFEITDGTNSSESTLIVADVQGTYNEQTKQITFSSENATPVFAASYITGSPLKGVQNKVKYFTDEEIENGSADVSGIVGEYYDAVQIGFKTEYGVAMWWSQRLTDEWEYWTPPTT